METRESTIYLCRINKNGAGNRTNVVNVDIKLETDGEYSRFSAIPIIWDQGHVTNDGGETGFYELLTKHQDDLRKGLIYFEGIILYELSRRYGEWTKIPDKDMFLIEGILRTGRTFLKGHRHIGMEWKKDFISEEAEILEER